jgi:queuine/archaeosine tRNA-ribosyltransferase
LGLRLNTIHNLHFLLDTMRRIRAAILDGSFAALRADSVDRYIPVPDEARQRAKNLDRRRTLRATAQGESQ